MENGERKKRGRQQTRPPTKRERERKRQKERKRERKRATKERRMIFYYNKLASCFLFPINNILLQQTGKQAKGRLGD